MRVFCFQAAHRIDAQVQWDTMSTASSPVPMLRPAVLNCSLLYTAPLNLMSTHTRKTASRAKMKPNSMMTIHPAAWHRPPAAAINLGAATPQYYWRTSPLQVKTDGQVTA